jgi:transposase
LADDRGRPVAFALTPGNVADITMAIPLLAAVDKPRRLLADKAYDADSFRNWLKQRRIKAVIPSTATRRAPYPLDQKSYRRRNVIERMFCKLKNWRRIATRYDRHAQNYLSGLALAAIMCLWTSMSPQPSPHRARFAALRIRRRVSAPKRPIFLLRLLRLDEFGRVGKPGLLCLSKHCSRTHIHHRCTEPLVRRMGFLRLSLLAILLRSADR